MRAPYVLIEVGSRARYVANPTAEPLSFALALAPSEPSRDSAVMDCTGRPLAPVDWPRARAARGERFSDVTLWWRVEARDRLLRVHSAPFAPIGSDVRAMALTFEDLTELAALKREIETFEHGQDELLAIAAHELRSPISTIQLMIERLGRAAERGEQLGPTELGQRVGVMRRQIQRLKVLAQNLTALHDPSTAPVPLDVGEFDLCELLADVVERWAEFARKAGTRIDLVTCEPAWGKWDRLRVEQVLNNLFANAIKYGRGAPVSVELVVAQHGTKRWLRIAVEDSGVGVPEDERHRIFDRYHRVPMESGVQGLGLGLYIVREIVRAHGGRVWHEARETTGSRFVVELPYERDGEERGCGGMS